MFGKFLISLRKQHGLNQEYVANKLGVSRPTYMQIERDERDLTISEANTLAKLFELSLDDLLNQRQPTFIIDVHSSESVAHQQQEIRISIPQQKLDKFKQVLLYILQKVGGKPNIGMTAIYKILYFIDLDYYEKNEEQLMGLVYIKNHFGPTPIIFDKVIQELVNKNQIEIIKSKFYQHEQKKYLINPDLDIDLSLLNGNEKEHIDWELGRLSDLNAKKLSDISHKDVPWISAEVGKPIDYEAVFYRTIETSVREYQEHLV